MYEGSTCSGRLDESLMIQDWKCFDGRLMIVTVEIEGCLKCGLRRREVS